MASFSSRLFYMAFVLLCGILSCPTVTAMALPAPVPIPAPVAIPAPVPTSIDTDTSAKPQKFIIIYEKGLDTPESVFKQAEKTLKDLGAKITYEYHSILLGFSVTALPDIIDQFKRVSQSAEWPIVVEKDSEVSANSFY